jgi:glycosyltransferase involved in cell wall biosynthesis
VEWRVSLELVSAIIPVLNGERYIGRTLDSVLQQSYPRLELVVVDDGSTDATQSIITAAASSNERIRFLTNPAKGVAAARNHAMAHARGSLIAPLDADDIWHPEKIARQVELLGDASPRTGVVYCRSIEIDECDRVIKKWPSDALPQGDVVAPLVARNFVGSASAPLIRRSYLEAVGGYDVGLWEARAQGTEDWKLYLQLAEVCDFAAVPDHLVAYRKSENSMSMNIEKMARSCRLIRQWSRHKWPSLPAEVWRRHDYCTNNYIANQAVVHRHFSEAVRYQLRAIAAAPAAALTSAPFWLWLILRWAGYTRSPDERTPLGEIWPGAALNTSDLRMPASSTAVETVDNGSLALATPEKKANAVIHPISLVIATRNRARSLERCLSSIRRIESRIPWELILVDNGSTDHTPKLIADFRDSSRMPVITVHEPRAGLARAHNAALQKCRAQIVAFTDDDCYPASDFIERVSEVFQDPAIGFMGGRIRLYDPTDVQLATIDRSEPRIIEPFTYIDGDDMKILGANMAFRRRVLEEIDGFDPHFGPGAHFNCEDVDAFARASFAGWKGIYWPNALVLHHHGRKADAVRAITRESAIGRGAYFMKFALRSTSAKRYAMEWLRRSVRDLSLRPRNICHEIKGGLGYLCYVIALRLDRPRGERDA